MTRRAQGFTYIEMIVIILFVGLLAAIVVRNLFSDQQTRSVWQFKRKLIALALQARNQAIESGNVVSMSFVNDAGEGGKGLVRITQEGQDGSNLDLQALDLPSEVSATRFDADKNEAAGSQWRMPYYPDGAASGGGIEFQWGDQTFSFAVGRTETAPRIVDGELPDLSLEQWSAGGYAPRS